MIDRFQPDVGIKEGWAGEEERVFVSVGVESEEIVEELGFEGGWVERVEVHGCTR